jgi:hypothetical protein
MPGAASSFVEMELRSFDTRRHWSASSQAYAPADVLLGYLADGWQLSPVVGLEEHWHAGARRVDVFHFELTKEEQVQILPVQSNPIVRRLMHDRKLRVVLLKREAISAPDKREPVG